MRATRLGCLVIAACFLDCVHSCAQDRRASERRPNQALNLRVVSPLAPAPTNREQTPSSDTPLSVSQIAERVFKRESEEEEIIASYTPIVQTYIQLQKSVPVLGTGPKRDLFFLGIADYHKARIRVRSMTQKTRTGNILWSFEPPRISANGVPRLGRI